MNAGISLNRKFIAFTAAYTLVLVTAFYLYFLFTGRQNIANRASGELEKTAIRFADVLQREIKVCTNEVRGLVSSIQLAEQHDPSGIEGRMRTIMLDNPQKFESLSLVRQTEQAGFMLRPQKTKEHYSIRKSGLPDKVISRYLTKEIPSDCVSVNGPNQGRFGPVLEFALKNESGHSFTVHAVTSLNFLFRRIREQIDIPSHLSIYTTDSTGTIIDSDDPSLLKKKQDIIFSLDTRDNIFYDDASRSFCLQKTCAVPHMRLILLNDINRDIYLWQNQLVHITLVTLVIFVIGLAIAWSIGQRFARSIGDVTAVAVNVAQGDFSQKLQEQRNDELGVLFHTFNEMTDKLQDSYDALKASNMQLEEKICELTETRRELSQKQRLALLGEAISKISHEIQNKIGGVSIWIQNLERYLATDVNAAEYIDELKKAMDSFMDMLVHFKRFYREPILRRERTALGDLINDAIRAVQIELSNKHLTTRREITGTVEVHVDREQMKDVLLNLLLNAIYYSPENGEIEIAVQKTGYTVTIQIIDEGPGIHEEDMDKLFQPFYTSKSGGSGLGLAISQKIVNAHNGQLTARNRKSGGAIFSIKL